MSESRTFNPYRLDLARRRRGITKRALAEAVGIAPRSLTGYYREERDPPADTVTAFADTLRFPSDFFFGDTLEEPSVEAASFRALSRMTARLRDQAIAAGALGMSLADWIDERFDLPAVDIPSPPSVGPEAAAMGLRAYWRIGQRPVKNMIHLLERYGVRVFSLSEESADLDAFSFWRDGTPFVLLNTEKSSERSRMDAAHELGHLVMHRRTGIHRNRAAEREATAFGAAFLMPRGSVVSRVRRRPNLAHIIMAKRYWGVSVGALTYRLREVELLSDFQYRRLFTEISRHHYRKDEPNSAPRERSQVLAKVFQALRERGVLQPEVAKMLSLHPSELTRLLFRLVQVPMVVK